MSVFDSSSVSFLKAFFFCCPNSNILPPNVLFPSLGNSPRSPSHMSSARPPQGLCIHCTPSLALSSALFTTLHSASAQVSSRHRDHPGHPSVLCPIAKPSRFCRNPLYTLSPHECSSLMDLRVFVYIVSPLLVAWKEGLCVSPATAQKPTWRLLQASPQWCVGWRRPARLWAFGQD